MATADCFKLSLFVIIAAGTVGTSSRPGVCPTGEEHELGEHSFLQVQFQLNNNEVQRKTMAVKNDLQSKLSGAAARFASEMHSIPMMKSGANKTTQMELYGLKTISRGIIERLGDNNVSQSLPLPRILRTAIPFYKVVFAVAVQDQHEYQVNWMAALCLIAFLSFCLLVFATLVFEKKDIPNGSTSEGLQIDDIVLSCVGTMLEWFDFGLYGFFAVQIGDAFFPTGSKFTTLLLAFGTYAGGYAVRPIGGIVFGYIGDRQGRVTAILIALAAMVASTSAIGLLPPYSHIGCFASILAVITRLIQGLSAGGQQIGASIYMMERSTPERRCFFSSVLSCSTQYGVMLASCAATVVAGIGRHWFWRVPFLAAVLFGLAGTWASLKAQEGQEFVELHARGQLQEHPIREAFRQESVTMLQVFIMCALWGTNSVAIFVWMPTYQVELKMPPLPNAFQLNTLAMITWSSLMLFWGWLADHGNWEALIYCSGMLLTVLLPAVFAFFDSANAEIVFSTYMVLSVPFSAFGSLMPRWLIDRVPDPSVRFVTLGVAYGAGMATFAGTAPLLASIVVESDRGLIGLGFYLCCASCLACGALPWKQQKVNGLYVR